MRIAILGATSHIAKGLIYNFLKDENYELNLYARNIEKLKSFLNDTLTNTFENIFSIDNFGLEEFDVIINCVGFGTPEKVSNAEEQIFMVTEKYDNLILKNLKSNKDTLYLNFSSGAVYGSSFKEPASQKSFEKTYLNNIKKTDYYRLAKLNSEAKHRAFCGLSIIDIRVFGYISPFIDKNSGYLFSELLNCISKSDIFKTNDADIIRDYIGMEDLYTLVLKVISKKGSNFAIDSFSKKYISKFSILKALEKEFGLKYEITDYRELVPTGIKSNYYSINKSDKITFNPEKTSLEVIIDTMKILLKKDRK